MNNILSRI